MRIRTKVEHYTSFVKRKQNYVIYRSFQCLNVIFNRALISHRIAVYAICRTHSIGYMNSIPYLYSKKNQKV
jgi:hypothetical protein